MEKLNVYQKLAKARLMLQKLNIKPTGKNQGRFTYYELEDILPHITQICEEIGLLPVMSYTSERAMLTIYDTESEGTIELESPMSTAKLAGCHEVQNLGAVQTYEKRYLYMHAFDVAESDVLDGTLEIEPKPNKKSVPKVQEKAPQPKAEKAPADITEYLLSKGFEGAQAAKCGAIWDEAKNVLDEGSIREFKKNFKAVTNSGELEEWYRAVYWRVDAANKAHDALVDGKKDEEFEDDSPSLYEEDK